MSAKNWLSKEQTVTRWMLLLWFVIVLFLGFLIAFGHSNASLSSRQIADTIHTASHGRVQYVQSQIAHGIPVAQVRYPNHSLHNVFFFVKNDKVAGFIPMQPVYLPTGKQLHVQWPKLVFPTNKPATLGVPPPPTAHPVAPAHPVEPVQPAAVHIPQDAAPAPVVLKYIRLAHGFLWGKAKTTPIDALVDPNCIFCHKWYQDVAPAVAAGKITFRIIPVAALKHSSVPKAIEILSAKDPLNLWLQDEKHFDETTEEGGLPVNLPKTKAAQKAVAVNTAILYAIDNHHPFTPTFADTQNGQVLIGKNHQKELQHAFVQK